MSEPFDACITDPPYELKFMGRDWDNSGVAFRPETWRLVLDVLKPGGHLLAFGGSRTSHRMACAIEDAGFEIRDTVMWLYGTGFPKSHNLDGDWAGWGTALKPAFEPIIVARKPIVGTVAANVLEFGTGALNIDASKIPAPDGVPLFTRAGGAALNVYGDGLNRSNRIGETSHAGRWPANVIHDGSDAVMEAFAAYGDRPGGGGRNAKGGQNPNPMDWGNDRPNEASTRPNDTGSAARFFYSAKAGAADRAGSKHPTVKPLALMRYLCRLVTQPGGAILDPFCGSGTTLQAALECGFSVVGIERDAGYQADIHARLNALAPAFVPLADIAA